MFESIGRAMRPSCGFVVGLVLVSAAFFLPGCAKSPAYAPVQPWKVSVAPPAVQGEWGAVRVEIEDDGIEAQAAPPRRRSKETDDPTEPFSPNYGSVRPARGEAGLNDPVEIYEPEPLPEVIGMSLDARDEVRG